MKFRKVMAVVLAAALTFSMAACGSKDEQGDATPTTGAQTGTTNTGDAEPTKAPINTGNDNTSATNSEIIIGSWWYQYYDSKNVADGDMNVSPDWESAQEAPDDDEATKETKAFNRNLAQTKWDNVKRIEDKYGVTFWWENLTYEGVSDSINTSILAGAPDCDIYLVDAGMAVPAQVNGLAVDLKTILPADHDIFTTQKIASYFDLGDGKACIFYPQSAQSSVEATYPLAFNKQMLEDNNLEDPRELYKRGEWTWEKFLEYCQTLTQDTDGDGQNDQFGFCGFVEETFNQLMMSNGANIAKGTTETLSSPAIGETLQMLQDMWITYNVCPPYDFEGEPWNSMRSFYREGTVGFFPIAVWIQNSNGDYSKASPETNLTWDTVFCPWPVGPSGNQETNAHENVVPSGAFIIPAGVQEPEKVFNVMYDFWNFTGNADETIVLRDDVKAMNWWFEENAFERDLQEANFEVMDYMGSRTTMDLWQVFNTSSGMDFTAILRGEMTPAQFQETYKQQVQDFIDSYFGD